jgi:hypothetical protein
MVPGISSTFFSRLYSIRSSPFNCSIQLELSGYVGPFRAFLLGKPPESRSARQSLEHKVSESLPDERAPAEAPEGDGGRAGELWVEAAARAAPAGGMEGHHKLVYRLYTEEGLRLKRCKPLSPLFLGCPPRGSLYARFTYCTGSAAVPWWVRRSADGTPSPHGHDPISCYMRTKP